MRMLWSVSAMGGKSVIAPAVVASAVIVPVGAPIEIATYAEAPAIDTLSERG